MTKLSRRSILSGLAAAPFVTTTAPLHARADIASAASVSRKLYLYIHGAVIIDLQPTGMIFHAPKVTESGVIAHDYRAGYGQKGEGDEQYPGQPLALIGFGGANKPPSVDTANIPYLGPRKVDASGNFCSLITPFPSYLGSFRKIQKDVACGDFFPGTPDLKNLQYLPLVLRADFDLQANEVARFVGCQWLDDASTSPLKVHFRAEPGDPAYGNHNAFLALSTALGMQIQLSAGYSNAAATYGDPEERTLLEVKQGSTGGGVAVPPCTKDAAIKDKNYLLASHPANCVHLVVNNTGHALS